MPKYNILVFPCGSEIGLEIYRSLRYSSHVNLLGGSSIADHGKFVYETFIDDIPFIDSDDIILALQKIVRQYNIDAIYPTMDKIIWKLKAHEAELGCMVIASPAETADICVSKSKTYERFLDIVKVPAVYDSIAHVDQYPVFIKPDIGYGARGAFKADNALELQSFFEHRDLREYVISEYLPGEEYTIDCFTDRHGKLRFCGPRTRARISHGISVNSKAVVDSVALFAHMANQINDAIACRGAWFFQTKKDSNGELTLLEIASRLGGSSSLHRGVGVNFALLSVFDAFGLDVDLVLNDYGIELDRALDNKYKIDAEYSTVYVDFDDCLIIDKRVNPALVGFLYRSVNAGKKLVLLTRHEGDINEALKVYRLESLFDKIITVSPTEEKSEYIVDRDSIFIDDSFAERKKIRQEKNIPVFAPDMVECLY